jgi:hypothetical protein
MRIHASDGEQLFRFSRILDGESESQLDDDVLLQLAAAMSVGGDSEGSDVPAGFTYLGQFIAHDLSFSEGRPELGVPLLRRELVLGRSPALDLDSLYGDGPEDPEAADSYESDGLHLRVGTTTPAAGFPALPGHDLPRHQGSTMKERQALIPDTRNDANVAVAQTHLALIHFHNRVVDELTDGLPAGDRLEAARAIVTKHYQWMIKSDFLPLVCSQAVIDDVFENGRKAFDVGARTPVLTMPLEFALAAFRFGHSMLRRGYSWNRRFDDGSFSLDLLFAFSARGGDLRGEPQLPSSGVADFRRLYRFEQDDLTVTGRQFNEAMRIDSALAGPLRRMPPKGFGEERGATGGRKANLAFRDLRRAKDLKLATGQEVAAHLRACGVTVADLTSDEIIMGDGGARLDGLLPKTQAAIATDTPLWFYILREAEVDGGRLDEVGARIVVEVLHRAMQGSLASIVKDVDWRPSLGPDPKTFRMVDLLGFAFEEKKKRLAPLEMA